MLRAVFLICILTTAALAVATADEQFSFVDQDWVVSHMDDSNVRILDVRPSFPDYLSGHIPNAVYIADSSLRGPLNGMPVQFLSPALLQQLLIRAGVTDSSRVLIYSEGDNVVGATMVAYALERLGRPNVSIVDGGWTAFKATGRATQTYPIYKPGVLTTKDNSGIKVSLAEVKTLIGKPGIVFIDARPNKHYTGETNAWMRNGHIPGAINIDWHDLTEPGNPHKIKTTAQIQSIYDSKGLKKSDNIIVYCGTGREATLEYAVLKHMMGFPRVRLYEGSWTEYCAHAECKMETGNPQSPAATGEGE